MRIETFCPLCMVRDHPWLTTQALAEIAGGTRRGTDRLLNHLLDVGLVTRRERPAGSGIYEWAATPSPRGGGA